MPPVHKSAIDKSYVNAEKNAAKIAGLSTRVKRLEEARARLKAVRVAWKKNKQKSPYFKEQEEEELSELSSDEERELFNIPIVR